LLWWAGDQQLCVRSLDRSSRGYLLLDLRRESGLLRVIEAGDSEEEI
ncbi:uncharacterized protein METZ01_LOCUS103028, partial [marine metagenome]